MDCKIQNELSYYLNSHVSETSEEPYSSSFDDFVPLDCRSDETDLSFISFFFHQKIIWLLARLATRSKDILLHRQKIVTSHRPPRRLLNQKMIQPFARLATRSTLILKSSKTMFSFLLLISNQSIVPISKISFMNGTLRNPNSTLSFEPFIMPHTECTIFSDDLTTYSFIKEIIETSSCETNEKR